jgi:hypothetical protein
MAHTHTCTGLKSHAPQGIHPDHPGKGIVALGPEERTVVCDRPGCNLPPAVSRCERCDPGHAPVGPCPCRVCARRVKPRVVSHP